jgi:hypothetical protein
MAHMTYLDWLRPLPQPWYDKDWPQRRRRIQRAERLARWFRRARIAIVIGVAVLGWWFAIADVEDRFTTEKALGTTDTIKPESSTRSEPVPSEDEIPPRPP